MRKRDLMRDLRLCDDATPGSWKVHEYTNDDGYISRIEIRSKQYIITAMDWMNPRVADAIFIAEARNGWPHAIYRAMAAETRVEELEREVRRLKQELAEYKQVSQWALKKVYGGE